MQRGVAARGTCTFPAIEKLKISKATSYNNLTIFYLLGISFLRQNLPTILKLTSLGVNLLGMLYTVLEKSFINW